MPTTKKTATPKKAIAPKTTASKSVVTKGVASKKVKKTTGVKSAPCACTTRCKPEYAFWVNHGPVLETITDLKMALASITDEQYQYHTSREGNDFARWVRECVGDVECADRIARAKTRAAMVRALTHACCDAEKK